MEIVLFLWLAGIVDDFKTGLTLITVCMAGILAVAIPISSVECKTLAFRQLWWKISFWVSVCAIIFAGLLPNKNTLYLMAGGYYGQKALQSDTAQKVLTIVNGHLDEQIQKLTK